nr:hypothetical protein [Bacteroidales bacterium]
VLPILAGDEGASGDDGVYAEIMIEDIGWEWNIAEFDTGIYDADEEANLMTAAISATIHFNSLYLGLGAPDFEVQYVDVAENDYLVDANADALSATGGFTLGLKNDMIDFALLIASENSYLGDEDDVVDFGSDNGGDSLYFTNGQLDDDDAENYTANEGNLIFGAMATINVAEGVTVPLKFFYNAANVSGADDVMAFGMAPSVAMGGLTFDMPVDFVSVSGGTLDYSGFELWPSVGYTVMDGLVVATSFLYGSYTDVTVGIAIPNAVAEVALSVTDTEAFVPGLEWMLEVSGTDLMDHTDLLAALEMTPVSVDAEASYMMGGMKPYMSAGYSLAYASLELGLGVVFDADFTGIDNTVITLDYANDSLVNGEGSDFELDTATESGRVTLDFTVSF